MPQNGLYVYTRTLGDRKVAVLLNGKDEPLTVTMERTIEELPLGTTLRNPLSGEDVTIKEEMTFAPREVMILQNF
ncbi:MAG: cyclomaltodextrinase C-terminal domain-containing protein [Muribaculaceae bacterium]|nr:cyclomaltodextrinase C-terminal domain-containing protein [Muribaculaceae bacterium]